uniref:Peptidylamidoglycolate lyase n=1 Tax=Clastoptera arizonana TaxID=38151 RepID=A0A1B6DI40_9HEMI
MLLSSSFVTLLSALVLFINVQATANVDGPYDKHNHLVKREPLSTRKNFVNFNQESSGYERNKNVFNNPIISTQLPEEWLKVSNWPAKETPKLGQVSGVTINSKGQVLIFHRGDHIWNGETFDINHNYLLRDLGPISKPTIIVYDPVLGTVLQEWGEKIFFIPHGISVDHEDNLWLTDVALHQIFKFSPLSTNPKSALLQIGTPFKPGNSAEQFCKPTSVAVIPSGDFFVADGYCNSRIVKFNSAGVKISQFGRPTLPHGLSMPPIYNFNVPHALTLVEDKELVCVADRENGRVQCFDWKTGNFSYQIYSNVIGSEVYSVTYSPVAGGMFIIVNGKEMRQFGVVVRGFVVNADTRQPASIFGPILESPHDVAISADGKDIYVAEIGPFKIIKYSRNVSFNSVPSKSHSVSKATFLQAAQTNGLNTERGSMLPAVLVIAAALMFAGAILIGVIVYSRTKRRGMSLAEQSLRIETMRLVEDEY